jgi:TolB-like protein/tetratricopeptide (TPR) repeat protein
VEEKRVLESWKAIASYLGRSERTCRKWESELGLPIHRLEDSPRARVFAYVDELDLWRNEKLQAAKNEGATRFPRLFRKPRFWLAAATAAVVLVAAGVIAWLLVSRGTSPAPRAVKRVAVLPFIDLSPNRDHEHVGEGISDILINALNRVEGLRIPARSSPFYFKGKTVTPREVGQRLGVQWILEGSVQVQRERMRVIASLINVADGYNLWTERYDRTAQDMFAIEDDIALSVIKALKIRLGGAKDTPLVKQYTKSLEANDLYMRGQYFYRRGRMSLPQAIECYEKAIEKDPAFAMAYAGLATCHEFLASVGLSRPEVAFPKAKAAALRALEINPDIAEAAASLAGVKARYEWDFAGAEQDYKRAIEINPGYAWAHMGYANLLSTLGRHEEAIAENKKACELDPLSATIIFSLACRYYYARQYDRAAEEAKRGLELDPYLIDFNLILTQVYTSMGRYEEAHQIMARNDEVLGLIGHDHRMRSWYRAYVYAVEGNLARSREHLDAIEAGFKDGHYAPSTCIGLAYGARGEYDQAFDWLEKAFQAREGYLISIKVNPWADPLRSDPRFADLLRRIGLEK